MAVLSAKRSTTHGAGGGPPRPHALPPLSPTPFFFCGTPHHHCATTRLIVRNQTHETNSYARPYNYYTHYSSPASPTLRRVRVRASFSASDKPRIDTPSRVQAAAPAAGTLARARAQLQAQVGRMSECGAPPPVPPPEAFASPPRRVVCDCLTRRTALFAVSGIAFTHRVSGASRQAVPDINPRARFRGARSIRPLSALRCVPECHCVLPAPLFTNVCPSTIM